MHTVIGRKKYILRPRFLLADKAATLTTADSAVSVRFWYLFESFWLNRAHEIHRSPILGVIGTYCLAHELITWLSSRCKTSLRYAHCTDKQGCRVDKLSQGSSNCPRLYYRRQILPFPSKFDSTSICEKTVQMCKVQFGKSVKIFCGCATSYSGCLNVGHFRYGFWCACGQPDFG